MPYPNAFDASAVEQQIARLENLKPDSQPQWGTMNAAQMLAHVNVSYDLAYGRLTPKINGFMKIMMKLFVKKIVVSDKPYSKNSRTAPYFLIADEREFEQEKQKLIDNLRTTQQHGAAYFEGKASNSFGKMTAAEWSNQFSKHLDHHFNQFGI